MKNVDISNHIIPQNKREQFNKITDFIDSDICYEGKILVLYGLRRTGKTTLIEQVIKEHKRDDFAYYLASTNDTMTDVFSAIIQARESGKNCVFIDEITLISDFIDNCNELADIYAKQGIRIILTGTDSLSFLMSENNLLFDRTVDIHTTYIPFAEHSRVLEAKSIDDYIMYGGLMRKGDNNDRIVYDYLSACRYLDSAVAGNIAHSIKNNPNDDILDVLSRNDIRIIIDKIVEKYSGTFNEEIINQQMNKASINYVLDSNANDIIDRPTLDKLLLEKKDIAKDFLDSINMNDQLSHKVDGAMVGRLISLLGDMNVLSTIPIIQFNNRDNIGWSESDTKYEYYIIQPAIKYYHLVKGKEFIENDGHYSDLPMATREILSQKLDKQIKGLIAEQIILFDTMQDLKEYPQYKVCKPEFYENGRKLGEYDMLIYDKHTDSHIDFEVKHTDNAYYKQYQHLEDENISEASDKFFGDCKQKIVLYNGHPFITPKDIAYINMNDFMTSLYENKDKSNVSNLIMNLMRDLPVKDIEYETYEVELDDR